MGITAVPQVELDKLNAEASAHHGEGMSKSQMLGDEKRLTMPGI